MNNTIDLPQNDIEIIVRAAEKYPQIEKVIVFGSRALGNAKPGSDVDLAIFGGTVNAKMLASLHDYLDEQTNLPYFFDIVHYDTTENEFLREHIMQFGKPIYENKPSANVHV